MSSAVEAPYVVVDVFTDRPLEGNQLAVFTEAGGLTAEQMQRLACEVGFSESVFVVGPAGDGGVPIRIFTPNSELPFAGHPVLGCAFVIAETGDGDTLTLGTGVGPIPVQLDREDGRVVFGRMEQAIPEWRPYDRERELLAALGVERSGLPVEGYPNGPLHVYVELPSEDAVAALTPDFTALAALGRDLGANCFAGSGGRWKTRMFGPGAGIYEDPATGSAAGPLAIHLARHGRIAFGDRIEIRQGAEIGRPSVLYARAEGSGDRVDRVEVGGSAVIVARGEFRIPAGP